MELWYLALGDVHLWCSGDPKCFYAIFKISNKAHGSNGRFLSHRSVLKAYIQSELTG